MLDVLIVGGGPHALAALSAVMEPVIENHLDHGELSAVRLRENFAAAANKRMAQHHPKVAVVDPHESFLHDWRVRFGSLGIEMLRSPAFAHPDLFSDDALVSFAWKCGRLKELHAPFDNDSGQSLSQAIRSYAGRKLLDKPSTALFLDFCADLESRLPHEWVKGWVEDIELRSDGTARRHFRVSVSGGRQGGRQGGRYLAARHVIVCAGRPGAPTIPKPFQALRDAEHPAVFHVEDLVAPGGEDRLALALGRGAGPVHVCVPTCGEGCAAAAAEKLLPRPTGTRRSSETIESEMSRSSSSSGSSSSSSSSSKRKGGKKGRRRRGKGKGKGKVSNISAGASNDSSDSKCDARRALVVGGGLSAAQAALRLCSEGAAVTLCSRRALTTAEFDLPSSWLNWRLAEKNRFEFFKLGMAG